jgi:prephenate dehydrogenase
MDGEPGFGGLASKRVVIWGLGLMGGSLALALRGRCRRLAGIDSDPSAVSQAMERGVVDEAGVEPAEILESGDLIVLAVPVRTVLSILVRLPDVCPGPAMVLDLGSTKRAITSAMQHLPERFAPVGGHPMCGKEKSSLRYAEASLYQNAPFALVQLERTPPFARELAEELAAAVGALPFWLDPAAHDRWTAATSHAPFLIASALAGSTPVDASALVGPGFRSAARLAGSSPEMMVDILATNAEPILAALMRFRQRLDRYEALLEQGAYETLAGEFREAAGRLDALAGSGTCHKQDTEVIFEANHFSRHTLTRNGSRPGG